MREILFKAKRLDNGEWVEGVPTYPEYEIGKCYMITRVHGIDERFGYGNRGNVKIIYDAYEVYPETVCQYTGLKDKHGVKVFEGDKLVTYDKEYTFEVIWNKERLRYELLLDDGWCSSNIHAIWQSEVIGNIYDKEENHGK